MEIGRIVLAVLRTLGILPYIQMRRRESSADGLFGYFRVFPPYAITLKFAYFTAIVLRPT